jgi:hypothetical protein
MLVVLALVPEVTVWLSVSELVAYVELPLYLALMVLGPAVLNVTEQLPLPLPSVMVQFESAPVTVTVPVGVEPGPLIVTLTLTD